MFHRSPTHSTKAAQIPIIMAYSKTASRTTAKSAATSVYDVVTDQIVALLEQGQIPWRKPWSTVPAQNYASKTIYRGINSLLLNSLGFAKPYFLTFKQAQRLGGSIRKGAKTYIVTYWLKAYYDKTTRAELTEEEARQRPTSEITVRTMLRYYRVFHYSDVKNVHFKIADDFKRHLPERLMLEHGWQLYNYMPNAPELRSQVQQAYYHPVQDYINMPDINSFDSVKSYLHVFYHELVHSPGHSNRLAREAITEPQPFGSWIYSKEELVAELGSAFLMQERGLANDEIIQDSAAYIQGWLRALKNDKRLVVEAASLAQAAADYITEGR
jgi:antirestriction protein ArdC